jgi:hypothetical protein
MQRPQVFYDFVETVPRIHLLGLGEKGRLFGVPYRQAIAQLPSNLAVSTDANERRRQVGRASGVRRLTGIEDAERAELAASDPYTLGDELADSDTVPALAKMQQWISADNTDAWWWAYIAGADPEKTPAQNTAFWRKHAGSVAKPYGPARGTPLRLQLEDASRRWFAKNIGDEARAEAFAASPASVFDELMVEGDGSVVDVLQDAYRDLQLRLAKQEVKRRGVRRLAKAASRPLVIVGCGKQKLDRTAAARDLYTGGVFAAHRTIADHFGGIDYVASAKHGLIRASRRTSPYDLTLSDLSAAQRRQWSRRVADSVCRLAREGKQTRPVIALVGGAYSGWIEAARACGVEVCTPLQGMPAGMRRKAARLIREGREPPSAAQSWSSWTAQAK